LLILINVHYSLATLISTVLGVIFNFFTTGRIVFRSMDNHRFFRFGLVYAFTYFVNILLLRWLVDGMQMSKLIAGALVTLPVALLSYLLNAKWTFRAMETGQENLNKEMDNA
ncbi:MAG: GtrA family protein, partial [Anaerolineaceae bacterium]